MKCGKPCANYWHASGIDDHLCDDHVPVPNASPDNDWQPLPETSDERKVHHIHLREVLRHEVLLAKKARLPGQMWFDTGCRRCVSGPEDHKKLQAALAKVGLKPMIIYKQEEFIFGDAKTATSDCAFVYPTFQNGKFSGVLDIARVPVPCPALFSLEAAKNWKCLTDHASECIIVQKFNRIWPFQDGTPYLNVLDYKDPNRVDLSSIPANVLKDFALNINV